MLSETHARKLCDLLMETGEPQGFGRPPKTGYVVKVREAWMTQNAYAQLANSSSGRHHALSLWLLKAVERWESEDSGYIEHSSNAGGFTGIAVYHHKSFYTRDRAIQVCKAEGITEYHDMRRDEVCKVPKF